MNSALDTINNILDTETLYFANLKYCLVSKNKLPFRTDSNPARVNNLNDFVDLEEIMKSENLSNYAGLGISVQASNICAIDVDKCFEKSFDLSTGDERAKYIINLFKNLCYIEFSFSGKGLRLLFRQKYKVATPRGSQSCEAPAAHRACRPR